MTSKLASLHAGLVARKGEATPAQTNPHFSYNDMPRPEHPRMVHPTAVEPQSVEQVERRIERPRWPHPAVPVADVEAAVPDPSVVREIPRADRLTDSDEAEWNGDADRRSPDPSPVPQPTFQRRATDMPKPASVAKPVAQTPPDHPHDDAEHDPALRHRFTFRMTHEQRHRLRLAAAIRDQSLQTMLSDALDNHLNGLCACSLKDCACMAAAEAAQR